MKDIHNSLLRAIKEQTRPARILSHVIANKFAKQGGDRSKLDFDKLESAVQDKLNKEGLAGLNSLSIETGDAEFDAKDIKIILEPADIKDLGDRISETIEKTLPKITVDLSRSLLRGIKRNSKKGLQDRRVEQISFESGLYAHWGKALDLLAVEVALGTEIGEQLNESLRKKFRKKNLSVVDALTRLHARAIQVAREVEILLLSGYADGAIARWRTLHEICVVSWFIREQGNEVAERYLSHVAVDSWRGAIQYNQYASILNYEEIPKRELKALEQDIQKLKRRFGEKFLEEYGWASEALGKKNPRFSDIERSVGLSKIRPYYKLASHNIHGGPKGAIYRIGLPPYSKPMLLAGPSSSGLEEAGRLAAFSFAQITTNILLFSISFDSLVWSRIMLALSRNVEAQFIKSQLRLEQEGHKKLRRKQRKRISRSAYLGRKNIRRENGVRSQ
ncbi:MAG: DUF5677 domain-containing protein [Sulfuricaulis sp.]|uniref:DUF5677 domain-containing protein n=1 Tax=Sulfuricaulis sp. TaxID=2003553 RepID=UPI0034A3B8F7